MSESDARSALARMQPPVLDRDPGVLLPGHAAASWPAATVIEDQQEARRTQRARRQALLMLIASSVVSVAVLYGLWTLFVGLV